MQLNLQAKDVSKCWLHLISVCIGLFFFMPLPAQEIKDLTKNKRRAIAFLNAHQKQLAIYSDSIAMFAEPSLGEIKSSRLIMDVLMNIFVYYYCAEYSNLDCKCNPYHGEK